MEGKRQSQGDVQICIEGRSDTVGTAMATATADLQRHEESFLEDLGVFRGRSSSCCATLPDGEALPSEKLSTCERTPRQRSV
jgi:hypothetical protein